MKKSHFTLTELRVIIAVMVIFAAMLPAILSAAREQVEPANCTNNLKQLGLAAAMYSDVNEDYMLPLGYGPTTRWMHLLDTYVPTIDKSKGPSVFLPILGCPQTKDFNLTYKTSPQAGRINGNNNTSYGMNQLVTSNHSNKLTLARVKTPDLKLHIADNVHRGGEEDPDHKNSSDASYAISSAANADYTFSISKRHNGGCNILYVDGHVNYADAKARKALVDARKSGKLQAWHWSVK